MAYDDDDDLGPRKLAAIVGKRQDAVVIEKADGGAGDLAGALVRHLKDRLESKREVHGFAKSERESNMTRTESLRDIAKTSGILAVAKVMLGEGRSYGLTETEFTEIATENALKLFPNAKTPAAAFSQMFLDGGPDGLTIRRAHALVRAEQLYGPTVKAADRGLNSAYGELQAKAAELRKVRPELSEAQAFAKVFSDPANSELARRERRESSAAR
jgi:hypothetical protein